MSRHYSTRDFFRQLPNALLARYFQALGLFGDLDFSAMKETKPDELFTAWLHLPDGQRNKMDAEFRDICELSCEKGFRAIIDEAEWHLTTSPTRARDSSKISQRCPTITNGQWHGLVAQHDLFARLAGHIS